MKKGRAGGRAGRDTAEKDENEEAERGWRRGEDDSAVGRGRGREREARENTQSRYRLLFDHNVIHDARRCVIPRIHAGGRERRIEAIKGTVLEPSREDIAYLQTRRIVNRPTRFSPPTKIARARRDLRVRADFNRPIVGLVGSVLR